MKNSIAFVLGNGTSRQHISLNNLKEIGTVYGCNALYRTFTPHYLISVNPEMIDEVKLSKYEGTTYFDNPHGWSSGPTALWLASTHGYETIYMLGIDFVGIDGNVNNIYAGTQNYVDKDANETYYGNWINQIALVLEEFPQVNYIRVKNNNFTPEKLSAYNNYKEETVEKFLSTSGS